MSRIFVKNLPKYVTEDRLREVFSQKGEITDAKVLRTKDGKSRQIAFIGFRTHEEAEEAIEYFDKSYLDTSRINCEVARPVGDPDIPRPWSRHSLKKKDSEGQDGKTIFGSRRMSSKGENENSTKASQGDDPQLQEFLQVMQPRVKSKLWANDTLVAPVDTQNAIADKKKILLEKEKKENSAPSKVQRVEDEDNDDSSEDDADKNEQNISHDEVISDMDYFKSRVKKDWSESESSEDEDSNDDGKEENEDSTSESSAEEEEGAINSDGKNNSLRRDAMADEDEGGTPIEDPDAEVLDPGNPLPKDPKDELLDTGRLFVRNLPYTAMEEELEELFSRFGNVAEVHLVVDKDTRRSKGIAYIQYSLPEAAARALEELDSSIFQGRLLHVMPAMQKPSSDKQGESAANQAPQTLKQRRQEEKKAAEASGDTRAWNTLFMSPDTVVENIARKYGVSKGDFLDREADDLAVRIALGETQVIAETKKALSDAGVNVAALEEFAARKTDGAKRSNHVLLVKNLPYGSSGADLAKMFGKFGRLDKVILPPTRTMALVVFLESSEARAAFKGLAYKRYKDAPLYLEWAPGNILSQSPASDNDSAVVGQQDAKRVILEQHVEGISDADVDPDRAESRSLYVKNLNFKTSDEALKSHFSERMKEGKILSAKIKKHMKNGEHVSSGFGFIEFDSTETATNICRDLQGSVLDGHALILQPCQVNRDGKMLNKADKDGSLTKLLVKNVAFEATKNDLKKLFSPFGKIKSLRLPMKFGSHRGYAFVEFVSKQEAQNALQALSNTHLYGRHLVLERAKESETMEELRARTAAQFTDEQNGYQNPTKLSKKRKHMAVLYEGKVKFERIAD